MIEKLYNYKITDEKTIERIVDDENINLNHMVLIKGTGLPEHYSNSNVYMVITRNVQKAYSFRGGMDIILFLAKV